MTRKPEPNEEPFFRDPFARQPPRGLTVAGYDPLGFAGITADLRTFANLGVLGCSAVTSLTVQTPDRFERCEPVTEDYFRRQLNSIRAIAVAGPIKIGLIGSNALIGILAEFLTEIPNSPVILDPVLAPSAGASVFQFDAPHRLFSRATLITPNLPEAERLLQRTIRDPQAQRSGAKELFDRYGCAVLLKGGHLPSEFDPGDALCQRGTLSYWSAPRRPLGSVHGSGCFLSTAIAAFLARGHELESAVQQARNHLAQAFDRPLEANGFPLLHAVS